MTSHDNAAPAPVGEAPEEVLDGSATTGDQRASLGGLWAVPAALGVLVAVLALLFAPHAPPPRATFTGDQGLVADLETLLDPDLVQGISVARLELEEPEQVQWAVGGTTDGDHLVETDTPFETASIFKVITAMLLADMVEHGETDLDRTVTEIFPEADLADPRVGEATLADLATHHSGLPTVPAGNDLSQQVLPQYVFSSPYRDTVPTQQALSITPANEPGRYEYSNLAFAVLAQALAVESGMPYDELVSERVLEPLGMSDTQISTDGVPAVGAAPHVEPGAAVEPWRNPEFAAAGVGTWSTTADLFRLLTAVTDGTAPGMSALEVVRPDVADPMAPEATFDLGLAWHLIDVPELGRVTMHNGQTLGSHSMMVFNETHGVVVMSNSATVDASTLGLMLLEEGTAVGPLPDPSPDRATATVLTLAMVTIPPVLLLGLVLRRRTLITQRPLDRLRIVSLSLGALAWLLAAQRMGTWLELPMVLWALGAGLTTAGVVIGVWRAYRAPTEAGRWRWLHLPVFAVSVAFSVTLATLSAWGLAIAAT